MLLQSSFDNQRAGGSAGHAPLRVLLVEDSQVLADRLRELLLGIPRVELLCTVESERDAVQTAARLRPDLIILDLHLAQGTGFGVMRALRDIRFHPSIIVLTTYALDEYRRAALALGASYFLEKSTEFDQLPGLIGEVTAKRLDS
ncbi:MAG: response regulator [Steroidobacteraceae bacterium]